MIKIVVLLLCFSLALGQVNTTFEANETVQGTCTVDSDCKTQFVCTDGECVHKSLFPLSGLDILVTVIVTISNGLGTSGGVGEGALLIPYLILIGKYAVTQASSIAYVIVFGGVLGNLLNIVWMPHEKSHRPLINYDLNLLIIPALLIGVPFGVVLHTVLPPLAIYIGIIILLTYFISKIVLKIFRKPQPERPQLDKSEENENLFANQPQSSSDMYLEPETKAKFEEINRAVDAAEAEEKEDHLFPRKKYQELLLILLAFGTIILLKGSKDFESVVGIGFCSPGYWSLYAVNVVIMSLLFYRNTRLVLKWQKEKEVKGYQFAADELQYDNQRIITILILSVFAGLVGGTLSVGGALVIAPTLLDWGMPPKSVAVTTGFFIVFTMLDSTLEVLMYGQVTSSEFFWFASINFVFSFITSRVVITYAKKYQKENLILAILGAVGTVSQIVMIYLLVNLSITSFPYLVDATSFCS